MQQAGSLVVVRQLLVEVPRLSCSVACGILGLQLDTEPGSPALGGGFLTAGPPGKSLLVLL